MEDIKRARGKKNKPELTRLENTAKNLANLVTPLPGKKVKECYRSYAKAFRKKVERSEEKKYCLVDAETFCFPALDYAIDFELDSQSDFLLGDYCSISVRVFEWVDADVLYYRAITQPSRRVIQHFLKRNLTPFVLGEKFAGSLVDIFLTGIGNDFANSEWRKHVTT
jgi:hypothetical protein